MGGTPLQLGSRMIKSFDHPYVIAEIGVNHEGSLEQAKKLIDLAKAGGADAAKFQSYKAELLVIRDSPAYWDQTKEPTKTQYELFKKLDSFGPEEFLELADHCSRIGIDFISTPFDLGAVDFLAPLVPFFKVASADVTNFPLLRRIGRHGKPVLMSTGASNVEEIDIAIRVLKESGCDEIGLLHCVLSYPTEDANAHLRMISGLINRYPDVIVGYSDHTVPRQGLPSLLAAWLLGAAILEKHFTHDKSLPGNDHYHAMDSKDLSLFRQDQKHIHGLLGSLTERVVLPAEVQSRLQARRSIVYATDLSEGSILSDDNLVAKRPGNGVPTSSWDQVVGRRLRRDVGGDSQMKFEDLE